MTAVVIGILALMAAVCAWTAYQVFTHARTWVGFVYLASMAAVMATAWFTTYRYRYFVDKNTEFYGWPIPVVCFQREGPGEPWLDYLGITVYLAFPLNALLFAFIPSLVLLLLARLNRAVGAAA